jgi:hypothetical protein
MKTLQTLTIALLLALSAAACGPTDAIPTAYALQPAASTVLYPAPAEGSGDGQVYEYH